MMRRILILLSFLPTLIFAQTTNLFISEYGEGAAGSGNKKYIEIYNGTGASVDLSNYQILRSVNGAAYNATPIALSGTLANNDAYVIGNNATDVPGADVYNTNISHNGDDGYALSWNGGSGAVFAIIDVFGLANGVDPGTSWTVAGNANATVDKILIRKPTVCSPSTDWATIAGTDAASSQYTIVVDPYNATSQTTDLGIHTASCISSCNTTGTLTLTVCNSYTVPSGDETYNASGTYLDTIPNAASCDSVITINLTITSGITYYADVDVDGLGSPTNTIIGCSLPVGYVTNSNDCDDNNNLIGLATTVYYLDSDNDTYGSPTNTITACSLPVGYVTNNLDCNDNNNMIYPGATEILDNGIDEDCSGSDASAAGTQIGIYEFTAVGACPVTADTVTTQPAFATFTNYTTSNTVCSVTNNVFSNSDWNLTSTIDPTEYNEFGVDADDCYTLDINKIIFTYKNSGSGGTPTWTLRSSLDNYTADLGTGTSSTFDATDTIILPAAFDAIDTVKFRFYLTNMGGAGATWRNDNVRIIANYGTLTPQTYYADLDADTYGDPASSISACTPPANYVLDNTDCDDTDGLVNPMTVWFQDVDGDLVGNANVTLTQCAQPVGYVLNPGDCDENNNLVTSPSTYYVDADNDGHGSMVGLGLVTCTNPGVGYATVADDCDDTKNTVYPGAPELCDGLDNDCVNGIDDGLTFTAYFIDADNDNFGTGNSTLFCQNPGVGYATVDGDCDDANANVYPGATEILDNGVDENCDGTDNYLGLNELAPFQFVVVPNPTNGVVTIETSQLINGTIECIDLNGRVLSTTTIHSLSTTVDFSNLSDGNYILKITSESGIRQQRILIKK